MRRQLYPITIVSVTLAAMVAASCSSSEDTGEEPTVDASAGTFDAPSTETGNAEGSVADEAGMDTSAPDTSTKDASMDVDATTADADADADADAPVQVCPPASTAPCYSGPVGTEGVGICKAGTKTCLPDGSGYGPCAGEVLPAAAESCATPDDDNCDGQPNEGCVCAPNATASCYTGPAGTEGVGLCKAGTKTCAADGLSYGPCVGDVTPAPAELCGTPGDDNCDGQANEGCPAGPSYATTVQPILEVKCAPCHTTGASGGLKVTTYATTQLAAANASCAGLTKGACTIVRIHNGSMPQGKGCTGDPAADAANAACLTAAEQQAVSDWIAGGQAP